MVHQRARLVDLGTRYERAITQTRTLARDQQTLKAEWETGWEYHQGYWRQRLQDSLHRVLQHQVFLLDEVMSAELERAEIARGPATREENMEGDSPAPSEGTP